MNDDILNPSITLVVRGSALEDLILFFDTPRGEHKLELAYNVCNGLYWDNPNLQAKIEERREDLKLVNEIFKKNGRKMYDSRRDGS